MTTWKPVKFLLPGAFLLSLGLGNILVGYYKSSQYQEVIDELYADQRPITALETSSPMRRVQLSAQMQERNFQRLQSAQSRRSFYNMVSTGGSVFLFLGFACCLVGAIQHYRISKRSIPF